MKIAVIGLGYVGLPLARLFATKYSVVGIDINKERIDELNMCIDRTLEVDEELLKQVLKPSNDDKVGLFYTYDLNDIKDSNFYIVTVPTPVDKYNHPDMKPLLMASHDVGKVISVGDIVVYESTVYPTATEEECVPMIENASGLRFNKDFFVGYSPERVNPSDKIHTIENIKKITSGSTPEVATVIDNVYNSVLLNGTFKASSIKVAEAAKIIENTQRDINIAIVNEFAKIFNLMGINTNDVLDAASSKWNFLPFKAGLVGGHCIGVDPYYLAQKALEYGYNPELILAARRINSGMGKYIAGEVIKLMAKNHIRIDNAKILILGITFKENCTDIRNSRVIDIYNELLSYNTHPYVYDNYANPNEVKNEYGIELINELIPEDKNHYYDAIILAVAHDEFLTYDYDELRYLASIIYDVKGVLDKSLNAYTL
jgi:UDP-N-acetyl-D-galactosamine dehydrogenase